MSDRRHDDRIMKLSREYAREQDKEGMRQLFAATVAAIPPPRYLRVLEVLVHMVSNEDLGKSAELTRMLELELAHFAAQRAGGLP